MNNYKIQKELKTATAPFTAMYSVRKRIPGYWEEFFWFCLNWGLTLGTFGIYAIFYCFFYVAFFVESPATKFTFPSEDWEYVANCPTLEEAIALVEELKSVETEVYHF
jgi:hypothetical protein